MPIARNSSDDELLSEVRAWIELLAKEDFTLALQRIPGEQPDAWSPQLLQKVIAGYGLPDPHPSGTRFQVTSVAQVAGNPPIARVERQVVPPGAVAYIEHSVPLNGNWSDLTATFALSAQGSQTALRLLEVHVF
jgi:hypothetical protein